MTDAPNLNDENFNDEKFNARNRDNAACESPARNVVVRVATEARLVMVKDLRIEMRSRVVAAQIFPFGILVLLLFAFAFDPAGTAQRRAIAPGLFWATVLLASILAVGRSAAVEAENGARDGMRLAGLDAGAIFLGKVAAVVIELLILEVLLLLGTFTLYDVHAHGMVPILITMVLATIGIATTGTVYGVLAAGAKARETLVPILVLPICAPVMLGATKAFESALGGRSGEAWPWIQLLAVFAVVYTTAGFVAHEALLEET